MVRATPLVLATPLAQGNRTRTLSEAEVGFLSWASCPPCLGAEAEFRGTAQLQFLLVPWGAGGCPFPNPEERKPRDRVALGSGDPGSADMSDHVAQWAPCGVTGSSRTGAGPEQRGPGPRSAVAAGSQGDPRDSGH